jgi:uncharacterized protein GlcG (DUF336 family)
MSSKMPLAILTGVKLLASAASAQPALPDVVLTTSATTVDHTVEVDGLKIFYRGSPPSSQLPVLTETQLTRREATMRSILKTIIAAGLLLSWGLPARAQVSISGQRLPLRLALEAAQEAIVACQGNGYDVTATVVDIAGVPQVVLRADHATVHTKDSSYRKAYTIITMGPIFHVDTTSAWLELLSKYPALPGQALANTPNVTALPGGAAFKAGSEIIAGLGVGGSPGGDKDEVCARAGVAKVQDRLPK